MSFLDDYPPELTELEKAGRYVLRSMISPEGSGHWLEWAPHSDKAKGVTNEHFFPSIFPSFQPFNFPFSSVSYPFARFTSARRLIDELWKEEKALYESEKRRLAGSGSIIPEQHIPMLAARRDALDKQVRRYAERVQGYMDSILPVLKVWLVETEEVIRRQGLVVKENADKLHDLHKAATRLWKDRIGHGFPPDNLEKTLREVLFKYDTPPTLAEAQMTGVLIYARKIEPVLAEAAIVDMRRLVYERLLGLALDGSQVSEWRDDAAESEREAKRERLTNRPDVWGYVTELRNEGLSIEEARIRICEEIKELSGIDPIKARWPVYNNKGSWRQTYTKERKP